MAQVALNPESQYRVKTLDLLVLLVFGKDSENTPPKHSVWVYVRSVEDKESSCRQVEMWRPLISAIVSSIEAVPSQSMWESRAERAEAQAHETHPRSSKPGAVRVPKSCISNIKTCSVLICPTS